MERYRRTRASAANKEDKADFKVKIARQSIVCGIIITVVFVISFLKTDTAEKVKERIDSTLSYTVDYKSTVAEIMDRINNFTKGEEKDAEKSDKANQD